MVQDHYTFTNSAGKYLVHATITAASTGKNVAVMILEFLDKYESRDTLKALASDGTVTNTGRPVARIFAGGGGAKKSAAGKTFFWFVFTVVYGFLYYIVIKRYKD